MRTTLRLDDDLLRVVREIAASQRVSVGKALSDLARQALRSSLAAPSRNGAPLLPRRRRLRRRPGMDLVNGLRDES